MKAWTFIVFSGVMFASLGLVTKFLTTNGVDPLVCAAVPFSVSAVIAVALRDWKRSIQLAGGPPLPLQLAGDPPLPRPWREGLALGAINAAIPALLLNIGFSRLPASLVTLTLALSPVFTALTAHLAFRDDRFSSAKVVGLALSFGGVAFLSGLPEDSGSRPTVAFVATLIGAALSGATLVWVRSMATRHDPMTVLAPMQVGAATVAVAAASLTGHPLWNPGASASQVGIMAAMGMGTLLTYVTSLKASELAPASRVGMMGYLVPLVGVCGAVLLFDETLTPNLVLGGILILAGVTLVGRSNRSLAPVRPG